MTQSETQILEALKGRFNKVTELTPFTGELLKKNLLHSWYFTHTDVLEIYCTPEHRRIAIVQGKQEAFIF